MTEVPPGDDGRSPADEPDASGVNASVPPFPQGAYPPPFGADATVSDDDLAATLAAQTAMYTGPITIPVINSDPVFRPDPAELQADVPPPVDEQSSVEPEAEAEPEAEPVAEPIVLPPVPVPPPPPPAEYIAPDEIASDPGPNTIEPLSAAAPPDPYGPPPADPYGAPPTADPYGPPPTAAQTMAPPPDMDEPATGAPVAAAAAAAVTITDGIGVDDELSRTVENEAAAGSTLDAILLLENELRRRQGLAPVDPADEPPAGIDAAFGSVPVVVPVVAPEAAGVAPPGWTPAPDPENEGSIPEPLSDDAWLTAPPPAFEAPPLVEPPAPADAFDPATLTPPPVVDELAVDPLTLPPPMGPPAGAAPTDFADAPPPVVAATPFTPPAFEALVVGAAVVDPDLEGIDDLDRADVAAPIPVDESGTADVAPVPVAAGAAVVAAADPAAGGLVDPDPFTLEKASIEPTPLEQRAGHAARMFWLWFAANSSFVMVAVGATLFGLGMSLRQTLVAIVAGVALSALPLGLGTLAGKWSGQPTMTVSRASFGLTGNIVPAVLAVLGRALWGGVLLWLLAVSTAGLLGGSVSDGVTMPAIVALVVGAVLAALVAVVGFGLLYRVQRVLGILSILLLVITIITTSAHVDIATALQTGDGSWVLALGGAVVVFSVVGLAWAQSSSDLARYQRTGGSGAANMLWGTFGVILPTLLILSWGGILAASDAEFAEELARQPLVALAGIVPGWFVLPLLAVTAFGLVSGAVLAIYSGGLAVASAGLRTSRPISTLIAAALVALVGGLLLIVGTDTRDVVRDIATTLAVPVAAWAGIFASEMMIRLRRFHAPSLLAKGGVYPAVRWVNLIGLLVFTAVGWGFTSAQIAGFQWQGYLFGLLGITGEDPWFSTDVGVLLALALGFLLPLVAGIRAIRRQEQPIGNVEGQPTADAPVD